MLLALDTATLTASVALLDGAGRTVAARRDRVTTHSERLLALVDAVLAEGGVRPGALDAIACGAGPGSFTGLRIGLATAKGLCLATGRPLVLVSSLAALAARAPAGALAVGAIDAFKGEVYAGFYRIGDGGEPIGDPETDEPEEIVLPPARLAERLVEAAAREPGRVHLVGDVLGAWPVLAVPGVDLHDGGPPDAVEVARLAARRLAGGAPDDLAAAVPRYIRPSEAEVLGPRPVKPVRGPAR